MSVCASERVPTSIVFQSSHLFSVLEVPKGPAVIRKPRGRTWNPATDVDAFKQEIVETLARFMRTSFGDADTDIE